jgi:NMD protein affecting ribosome stability and mRNA decay
MALRPRERYVLPLKDAPRWERHRPAFCAECGQPVVVDGEDDGARLVCMDCLLKDVPPTTSTFEPHPFMHPEHCAECATFNPHPRRFDPPTWSGSW